MTMIMVTLWVAWLVPLAALVSAWMTDATSFDAIGQNRGTWLVVLFASLFVPLIGTLVGGYFLVETRDQMGEARLN
jgi:hypothetical protein